MEKINLGLFYEIGATIHPLTELKDEMTLSDLYYKIEQPYVVLDYIVNNHNSLYACVKLADDLLREMQQHIISFSHCTEKKDYFVEVGSNQIFTLSKLATNFENAYKTELYREPAYLLYDQNAYSINNLLYNSFALFNPLLRKIKGIEYEVTQVAKCIAFEIPTAAAFHLHKINEAVLRQYFKKIYNEGLPENPTMGVLINEMEKLEPKKVSDLENEGKLVIECLKQIKNFYRNPTVHFEEDGKNNISNQEAIELLGIINSVTSKMLRIMENEQEKID